jgi:hypothetical protein
MGTARWVIRSQRHKDCAVPKSSPCLDKFAFAATPLDEGQVPGSATGAFLDARRHGIVMVESAPAKPVCASASPPPTLSHGLPA